MATLYKENGEIVKDIQPKNGKRFTLEELYKLLRCDTVERVFIEGTKIIMIVDESGKIRGRPQNINATNIYHSRERMNIWEWIAGDALLCEGSQF